MGRPVVEMTGKRFGRWTVIGPAKRPDFMASNAQFWECLCDCGKQGIINGNALRGGRTKSCGCLRSEAMLNYHARRRANND